MNTRSIAPFALLPARSGPARASLLKLEWSDPIACTAQDENTLQ